MKTVFPFKTKNNNYYVYFLKEQILTLSNANLNILIEESLDNKFHNNNLGISSSEELNLTLLSDFKANGYFEEIDIEKNFNGSITEHQLFKIFSNIKQITFEVTEKCNLNCTYCGYGEFYEYNEKRAKNTLDVTIAKKLLDYLLVYWNSIHNTSHKRPIIISFYGGEPLLRPDIIKEIINYTKKLKLEHNYFVFNMTTNGTYLKKNTDFLVKNDIDLLISLDGNRANNRFRKYSNGKEAFNEIIENINYIKENYPEYFRKKINFNAVLHNLNSVEEIKNFIQKEFHKTPTISELRTSGIKNNKRDLFWLTYKNLNTSLHESENYQMIESELFLNTPIGELITSFLSRGLYFNKGDYNDFYANRINRSLIPTGTCLPMTKKLFITANGKLLPCERIDHEYSLGEVNTTGVDIHFGRIKDRYNTNYTKLLKLCSQCYNIYDCKQCMFYLNINDEVINCKGFTRYETYKEKLIFIVEYLEENPEKLDWIQQEYEYTF
ncbi:MAG: radical SAM peptide maturase [Bacteroidales bacterium]|jgi:uncharacterized protein|nr:radical SAM peptide maturase [Bacteroidales bacterium]